MYGKVYGEYNDLGATVNQITRTPTFDAKPKGATHNIMNNGDERQGPMRMRYSVHENKTHMRGGENIETEEKGEANTERQSRLNNEMDCPMVKRGTEGKGHGGNKVD